MENGRIQVMASIERVRFFKDNFGIIECSIDNVESGDLQTIGTNRNVVFTGNMATPEVGQIVKIKADYTEHPKFGPQYKIISMYAAIPIGASDEASKRKFLETLFTPLQVEHMYEVLPDPYATLEVNAVDNLCKVKGIGAYKAAEMVAKFRDNIGMAKIFTELADYNLTNKMVRRLMKAYNNSPELVIEMVTNNPYVLCRDVEGIGWARADAIALAGGIQRDDPKRIGAYILQYLDDAGKNGCSWITTDELLGGILENLGEDLSDEAITMGLRSIKDRLWVNDEETEVGLKKYRNVEQSIAEEVIRLRDAKSDFSLDGLEDTLTRLEGLQGWKYSKAQRDGIYTAMQNNITIIHGLAGTGKSTLVRALLEHCKHYSYIQTALSGRAAARMSEITGEEGSTIHRLLGFNNEGFEYNKENQLPYDIYIVDEISMPDAFLFRSLFQAIPSGSKVILLGDTGQLESIGCGNIAWDLIHCGEIPVVELTEIHRQAAKSGIITESIKVRHGEQLVPKDWAGEEVRGELQDLVIHGFSDASNTYYSVMQLVSTALQDKNINILETQVISPIKSRGGASCNLLNNAIQELYNPSSEKKKEFVNHSNGTDFILREGDKIINTANCYSLKTPIFNGNIGIIPYIDSDLMVVDFVGIGEVEIPRANWAGINLGYAITVHKSQGSQYDHVIFACDFSAYSLLSRELVYTAISRAKKKCDVVAQTGALRYAISRENVSKKQTHLQTCIHDICHPALVF